MTKSIENETSAFERAAQDARATVPGDDQLKVISSLVEKERTLGREVDDLEAKLKDKKAELRRVQEVDLPEAMDEAGTSHFTTTDGYVVQVETGVAASIPAKYREQAHRWLEEHGLGDLIKRDVTVKVGRDEEGYETLVSDLSQHGLTYEVKEGVHPQTLKAQVKRLLEQGQNVPADWFGIFEYRKAKVSVPRG